MLSHTVGSARYGVRFGRCIERGRKPASCLYGARALSRNGIGVTNLLRLHAAHMCLEATTETAQVVGRIAASLGYRLPQALVAPIEQGSLLGIERTAPGLAIPGGVDRLQLIANTFFFACAGR